MTLYHKNTNEMSKRSNSQLQINTLFLHFSCVLASVRFGSNTESSRIC